MRSTQQMSITLPNDMAEMVREKVAAGGSTPLKAK
jgi:Arc/MetJ-type ribon-helix-helix transcriptional regulator